MSYDNKEGIDVTDLTYKQPITPTRPFKVGDVVDVLDREHKVLSQRKVVMASGRILKTDCGRIWKQSGWWIGDDDRSWPFPSIRLSASDAPVTPDKGA